MVRPHFPAKELQRTVVKSSRDAEFDPKVANMIRLLLALVGDQNHRRFAGTAAEVNQESIKRLRRLDGAGPRSTC